MRLVQMAINIFGVLVMTAVFVPLASGQLLFLMEPPPRLMFSNSTGARVVCAAHGTPAPVITWLTDDGIPVADVKGLRGTLSNGTLWLSHFTADLYRSDVHAAVYRCKASNIVGTIVSRDMRVEAVMDIPWEPQVQSTHGFAGGAVLLTCMMPSEMKQHTMVTRWFRDGAVVGESEGQYIIGGSRGEYLVIREARFDDPSTYSCEVQNSLTADKRRSLPALVTVSHPTTNMAPRMMMTSTEESVHQGGDIRLVCCAVGNPAPTYSWFRQEGGRLTSLTNSLRISVSDQVLIIRRTQQTDTGIWTCRAHNQHGEQRRDIRLVVRNTISVTVQPQLQIADSGSTVTFKCSVEGGIDVRLRWLHDGAALGGEEVGAENGVLRLHGVMRRHRGMYQCIAEKAGDSAQAAAELRLGDMSPELQYTFIEQALHPGPPLTLHCAAAGSPAPRFTWLLDGQPVEERSTGQRSITQFMNANGDVVSYLNITSVRPEDGGRYTCRAHNSKGAVEHTTRLNVYGPPSVRTVGPVRVVAGSNATVHCPYSGFPISSIRWQRNGVPRPAPHALAPLRLWPAEPGDAGVYTCVVDAPAGQYAQNDVHVVVTNPPRISGFFFPPDLVEGSSVQVLCGITSGDKPVYFSWLKDGQHIPPSLQVQEKSLDEFSFLIFSHVASKHSGDYTCVASNAASQVNHTARLAVKVAPSWVQEPQDTSALLGTQISVNCATKGYPEPRIAWLKGQGPNPDDLLPLLNLDHQYSVLPNGTMNISPAAHHHEGYYMCQAENGIGRGLSKVIRISVNEPAHFEYSSRNMTVKRTTQVTLQCDALGDSPIQLQWTHNMKRIDFTSYRLSVSEKRLEAGVSSQLNIAHAERHDSGVYRCRAENAYGRDELLIYLAVQEFPDAPKNLRVSNRGARSAILSWNRGYDGNSKIRTYRLQYRVVGERQRTERDDWADAPTRDIIAEMVSERRENFEIEDKISLEYKVEGLRPATAYAMRVAAVNNIGESEFSDPIIVKTMEEAPSEPPHNVQVQATAPGELLVNWKPPPQSSWNGELLGYVVTWREATIIDNGTNSLTISGWGANEVLLSGLKTHAHYEVRVRAFNVIGAGPSSVALTADTLEGVPEAPPQRVHCEPLSSQSIRVWWDPPPIGSRGGVILGYDIAFESADEADRQSSVRRAVGTDSVLAVPRGGNYSLRVRARTAAGSGPAAALHCATREGVPGPPADIKALAHSEDTVIVSWLPPIQKNGKIKHYTVYTRPLRAGQHSQLMVLHKEEEPEYSVEIRGLMLHQVYEFWVTAATASGEGDMSSIVSKKPEERAAAKIASFGRRIVVGQGRKVRIRCLTAGNGPPSRAWSRARPSAPITTDSRFQIIGSDLIITRAERILADNYTCTARNSWGSERARWQLVVLEPPGVVRVRVTSAAAARLKLTWDQPPDGGAPIHGYSIQYAKHEESSWQTTKVPAEVLTHALERLSCGTKYKIRVIAHNSIGSSEPGDELVASTKGGPSKPSSEKDLISTNSTCVRLNLLTWESNGCPVTSFIISIKSFNEDSWRTENVLLLTELVTLCDLYVATWYHLKIIGVSVAGSSVGTYYFSTLTEYGERIPTPSSFPSPEQSFPAIVSGAVAAVILVAGAVTCGLLLWRTRITTKCLRQGYQQGEMSEDEDNKSIEKRDNKKNCQQVYTSSPIKSSNAKKDQQELYEISPYATFSMSGGAVQRCSTLRTFCAPDSALDNANRLGAGGKHPSFSNTEEYTLSRAVPLTVRRSDSDSDSSSPCAECTSVSYRMPLAASKSTNKDKNKSVETLQYMFRLGYFDNKDCSKKYI